MSNTGLQNAKNPSPARNLSWLEPVGSELTSNTRRDSAKLRRSSIMLQGKKSKFVYSCTQILSHQGRSGLGHLVL